MPMMEAEEQQEDANTPSEDETKRKARDCLRYAPLWMVLVLLAGAGALSWYFLDYRPRHLESTVLQFYSGSLRILNYQYSLDLGRPESRAFWTESAKLQKMLRELIRVTDLDPYYNSSTVYAFGEGSLTFFFWFALQVPESQHKEMTAERVNVILSGELLTSTNSTGRSYQTEYQVDPDSLILLETPDQSSEGWQHYSLLECPEIEVLRTSGLL